MFTLKSNVLPIIGMLVLLIFCSVAYARESVFMDKILLCSFILTTVFIGKMRSNSQ